MPRDFHQEPGLEERRTISSHICSWTQCWILLSCSQTGSHHPSQAGLELSVFLSLPPKCWVIGKGSCSWLFCIYKSVWMTPTFAHEEAETRQTSVWVTLLVERQRANFWSPRKAFLILTNTNFWALQQSYLTTTTSLLRKWGICGRSNYIVKNLVSQYWWYRFIRTATWETEAEEHSLSGLLSEFKVILGNLIRTGLKSFWKVKTRLGISGRA